MTPEQRVAFAAQARVQGARFIAGMLGKDLPPDVIERLQAESTPGAPSTEGGEPQ
jgi:hypothetical protein